MKSIKNNWHAIVLIVLVLVVPIFFISADFEPSCPPGKICNPLSNSNTITGFVQSLLTGVLRIGIPVVALAIIYSGFLFVAARGNSEKLGKAKDAILYTLIGAAILLGSWAIAILISETVRAL